MTEPATSSSPYGPGTPMVRRFLVQLAGLGAQARDQVVARYNASAQTRGYEAAETALGETIERAGRTDARDALAGPLFQLVRTSDGSGESDDDLATLDPIAEPALAALLALMVADLLPAETVALLYDPFDVVIPYASLRTAGDTR